MALVIAPTLSQVMIDFVTFIQSALGAVPVIQGIQNRTPAPLPTTGFVIITPIHQERLEFNLDTYIGTPFPTSQSMQQAVALDVQVDCYGPSAGDWAATLTTLFKDEYAYDLMVNCSPLYMEEAQMAPLIDSEQQFEARWTSIARVQYNPVVQPAQDFADVLEIDLVNVDEAYPS